MKQFHDELKFKMDNYAHLIYQLTKDFPKSELFGITSQLRRAGLSVILNYIEGYARARDKVNKNFLEISYGSLKESEYLIRFSYMEGYISKEKFEVSYQLADDIGGMLWGIIRNM